MVAERRGRSGLMLCQRGTVEDIARLQERGWLFDLKIDGVRCLATVERGRVTLESRTGQSLTKKYPEVAEPLGQMFPTGRWVFDGEIAVSDERGLPSWPLTHKRTAQERNAAYWSQQLPGTLHVFDVLHADHSDVSRFAFANRRQVIDAEVTPSDRVRPVLHTADGTALWEVVCTHNLEGVIAKRAEAPYQNRRSADWVKIKRTSTVSALVGGFDPGEGARATTFGCLHLYLLDKELVPVPVGKVGSGFSDVELRQVMHAMHHSSPLIVEVEYLDVSPDGQLRQPVFQRMRDDLTVTDCTMDQLT